ncbi:hypothetical protein [Enterococcus sp. HY326]|uniref:hypothetical protein n=1 Tax=Enterococcus sp. HY326 TaxID=2971265 RepID=UPI0022401DA5|nr:hypothetical protein [Enterococcus sp. HY326]
MRISFKGIHAELIKITSVSINRIVILILLAAQIIVAIIDAKSILTVGLDATPETSPMLFEAIPPVEFLGFDILQFGIVIFIALAALMGAADFSHHELRQGFLLISKRRTLVNVRFIANSFVLLMVSSLVISLSVITTHLVIGSQEIPPLFLQPKIWLMIDQAVLSWTFAGIFTFSLASLLRKALPALLSMNSFVVGLTAFILEKWSWTSWLPINAYQNIAFHNSDSMVKDGIVGTFCMIVWIIFLSKLSNQQFYKINIGGEY